MTPAHTATTLTWIRDSKRTETDLLREAAVRATDSRTGYLMAVHQLNFEVEALEQAIEDVAMNEKFAKAIVAAQWSTTESDGAAVCPWCHATMLETHASDCVVREAQAVLDRIEKERRGKQ